MFLFPNPSVDLPVPQQSLSAPVNALAPQQPTRDSISAPIPGYQGDAFLGEINWQAFNETVSQCFGQDFDVHAALDQLNAQYPLPPTVEEDDGSPRLPGINETDEELGEEDELMDSSVRRSRRAPAPTTRLELQNLIGTNTVLHPVPVEKKSMEESLLWFHEAGGWFKGRGLGPLFDEVVASWEKLEETLSYGISAKGSLPMAGLRPTEWRSWTSKGRMGRRVYEQVPVIDPSDAAEFGLTVLKWWSAMQPAFRQNTQGLMPLPAYATPGSTSDQWSSLRKGGPNGIVSVVTLLAWWGLAAKEVPEFAKDSRSEWKAMALDVNRAFREMTATANTGKRAAETESGPRKKPRQV
ncbi:hypothetical protein H1R20_g15743, partial [Candolleomyces eurysporus]